LRSDSIGGIRKNSLSIVKQQILITVYSIVRRPDTRTHKKIHIPIVVKVDRLNTTTGLVYRREFALGFNVLRSAVFDTYVLIKFILEC